MKELAHSKQINERKDCFPWLKSFLGKLVKKFPNDVDEEILQFLLQNVEEEIKFLPNREDAKTREALFDTIYDLFLHFWWRIRWNGKKKWSRCWKIVSSEVPYAHDERTKCCEKLLYYIIFLGITLSNGCPDSEWIGKVFKAIHILPSFDGMIYGSLLRVNNLDEKYRHVYIAILKKVLCSEVADNISEPVTYIKIIMLFRRLKKFTVEKITLSALKSTATSIKPPSETIQYLSSLEIGISLGKHKNIAKALLSRKFSNKIFKNLMQIITGTVNSEQGEKSLSNASEDMDKPKNVPHKKHHKHKRKSHKSKRKIPIEKLKDSKTDISASKTDITTAAATSTPFYNSNIKIKLNRKMLARFNTSPKSKELEHTKVLKKKKNSLKNSIPSKKELIDSLSVTKVNDMNEFLNFSFAQISNESTTLQPEKLQCATESINVNENDILPEETDVSLSGTNSSPSTHKRKQAEFCNSSLSNKRIKIDVKNDCSTIQSAQEQYPCNSIPDEIACSKSPDTLKYKDKIKLLENNSFSQEPTDSFCEWFLAPPSDNEETAIADDNATKGQQVLLNKVPAVSSVDAKSLQTCPLLKLLHPHEADIVFSLPSEVSVNTPVQNDTGQLDIEWNTVRAANELCGIIQENDDSRLGNEISHSTPIVRRARKFGTDRNLSNEKVPKINPSGTLQETVNSKQTIERFPIANLQNNDLIKLHCKNTNSAINTNKSSSFPCSTGHLNESIDKSGERFANFEDPPSSKLCNNFTRSATWFKNSHSTNFHQWSNGQSMIPRASKTLELTQTTFPNNSFDNTQHSTLNSESFPESNSINQRTDDRVCVAQNENTSHCQVDCKIVSDPDPSNESTSSIKVIINVTCKTPEGNSSHQKEHIFGIFDDKRTKQVTPNTSESHYNPLNPFSIESSTSEMPKLSPYYADPPYLISSIDNIATPPDSEREINVPGSFKRDNIGSSKNLIAKKLLNKRTCPSTPRNTSNALPKTLLTDDSNFRTPNMSDCETSNTLPKTLLVDDSDFRTPNTSDCETANEWSLEKTNLTNSLSLINSLQNSPVDNVLEQLNSKKGFSPGKNDSASAAILKSYSNKKVTYRSNENIYSGDDLSDDSTHSCFSHHSATDKELLLNGAFKKRVKHKQCNVNSQQQPNKVVQKKKKNPLPKKRSSKGLQGDSSGNANNRYNLRSRVLKPSMLEHF